MNNKIQEKIYVARGNFLFNAAAISRSMVFLLTAKAYSSVNSDIDVSLQELEEVLKEAELNHIDYFVGMFLINLISSFELFLTDCAKAVIESYPKKVGSIEFTLASILENSTDELISQAAENHLNKIMYEKPAKYLQSISTILSIDSSALEKYWLAYIEAKARRDLGIHNSWRVNDVYIRKAGEVNIEVNSKNSLSMIPDQEYFKKVYDNLEEMVEVIFNMLIEKYK